MRGNRLATYVEVCRVLTEAADTGKKDIPRVGDALTVLSQIEGVKIITKDHNGKYIQYLDVFGRQVPEGLTVGEARKVYEKPVREAGKRASGAMEAGGADLKALYHTIRIVEQGITLFRDGKIVFPCQNREYLMKIRAGEVEMDAILDRFDEKLAILTEIGDNSPLASKPDHEWMDDFVQEVYEDIVRTG